MNNEYITNELIENTYFFCVKRISNTEAAKDLSQDIIEELNIPVGTVKSRLFDARRNLKERFVNMNNTGKTAYAPAEVVLGWGFNAMKPSLLIDSSKIYPQIMVICRGDAKAVNEIADEMGVAPVYLEEAIEKMLNVNLLVSKVKGKYQVNHGVFPVETYYRSAITACNIFHENKFGERITEKLFDLKDKIKTLDFYGNHFDFGYLLWILYAEAGYEFGVYGTDRYVSKYADKFPDEAERDYRHTMRYLLADEAFDSSRYGEYHAVNWSCLRQNFSSSAYGKVKFVNNFESEPFPNEADEGIDNWCRGRDRWVNAGNISLLIDLAKNPQKELSAFEEEKAADFLKNGLLKKEKDGFAVQLPIFTMEAYDQITEMIKTEIKGLAEEYSDMTGKAVENELLPFVRKDLMSNFIHWDMRAFFQQTASLFYYGRDKHLALPEDYSTSAAGLYILMK